MRELLTETTPAATETLEEFKARVYKVAQDAKRAHGWCGEIDEMLEHLGVEAPASTIGEGPREDGLYAIDGTTFFIIRYTLHGITRWVHTALMQPQRFTPENPGSWEDMVAFIEANAGSRRLRNAGLPEEVLVKVG